MERYENNPNSGFDKRLIFAALLVLLGGLLLASNFHVLPNRLREIFFSWEMILIVIGIYTLANRQNVFTGVLLIGIGVFFLLPDIFYFPFGFHRLFWPVILIGAGFLLLFRRNNVEIFGNHKKHPYNENYIDSFSFFSGSEKKIYTENFEGGRVTSIFGGSTIDFTNSKLAEGTNYIDLMNIFGGTKIIVPGNWNVKVDVISIFGGFADKRRSPGTQNDIEPKLVIKGIALFGGGEIQSW